MVKLLLRKDNIIATKTGEVLSAALCKKVTPEIIYWDHQVKDVCYEDLLIKVIDRVLFASPHNKLLELSSFQKNCQQRLKMVYKKGEISANRQHHVPVQEIYNNLNLHLYKDHIEFTAEAYYNPDLEKSKKEID